MTFFEVDKIFSSDTSLVDPIVQATLGNNHNPVIQEIQARM